MVTPERPKPTRTRQFTRASGAVIDVAGYDPDEFSAYRKARGVTQTDLAAGAHVSQSYVSGSENAGRYPTLDAKLGDPWLVVIDELANRRDKMIAEGLADLERIRGTVEEAAPSRKAAKR